MSDVIKVGNRVRSAAVGGDALVVTAVGERRFLAIDAHGVEYHYRIDGDWLLVPEPVVYPERWFNVYADGSSAGAYSRSEADRWASNNAEDRLGVIHLHPDGTVELEDP